MPCKLGPPEQVEKGDSILRRVRDGTCARRHRTLQHGVGGRTGFRRARLPYSSIRSTMIAPDAAAAALQRNVTAAIARGVRALLIPGGNYYFHDSNFDVFGARGLALLAPEPVSLWFRAASGVNITNCEDLSLGNWTITTSSTMRRCEGLPSRRPSRSTSSIARV